MNNKLESSIMVIIPAYNEQDSIGRVIRDIPSDLVDEIVVVNNNSVDGTRSKALQAGATVLDEPRKGYGFACLKGIEYAKKANKTPKVLVFIDGDYSDYPQEMVNLINPIREEGVDFVIGSRTLGEREKGSMTPQQIFGNWLATNLLRVFYGVRYSDLGPFRAIRFEKLLALNMQDTTFGWTVEMQLKAAKHNLKIKEIPVSYRKRIGVSKISGTVKGTIMAGYKIIYTLFKYV